MVKKICLTPGAQFHTSIQPRCTSVSVDHPFQLAMTEVQAKQLEQALHLAFESLLAPYYSGRHN